MKILPESNEANSADAVEAALHEAARYESETAAPVDLVTEALARHRHTGRRCGPNRLVPVFAASTCGLILVLGAALWLHTPHHNPVPLEGPVPGGAAVQPPNMGALPERTPRPDVLPMIAASATSGAIAPPTTSGLSVGFTTRARIRHLVVRHSVRHWVRQNAARNYAPLKRPVLCAGVWKTEIVHRAVITQTVTPVWIVQSDPDTATAFLVPALYQLSLQPGNVSDTNEAQVSAALIPVHFDQENPQP